MNQTLAVYTVTDTRFKSACLFARSNQSRYKLYIRSVLHKQISSLYCTHARRRKMNVCLFVCTTTPETCTVDTLADTGCIPACLFARQHQKLDMYTQADTQYMSACMPAQTNRMPLHGKCTSRHEIQVC